MKLKIAAIGAAWLFMASTLGYAQTLHTLVGSIQSKEAVPLNGATAYLYRVPDSLLIKTAFADQSGSFRFENVAATSCWLVVSHVGYQTYRSKIIALTQHVVVPAITLLPATGNTLQEVQVSGQRAMVEQRIDRTVVNVEALVSAAGGTVLDALEKSPGVTVDQNGAISLKGKGVTVFVDDKPTYLSGAELENYLRSLSASAIDQLELMTNPPAKYDAAGNGGVINIRTKKTKIKGFNGGLNLAYTQGKYAKTNNSVNFNYRNNKLNLSGSSSYNIANGFNNLDINRHFQNAGGAVVSNFLQNSYLRRTGQSFNIKFGLDYYLSDKTTLGLGLTGVSNPTRQRSPVTSLFLNAQNRLDSTVIAQNDERRTFRNGGINLNYRHQYDKNGRELTADADYLNYRTGSNQFFQNSSYTASNNLKLTDLLTGNLPTQIHIYSAKTDYTHPLKSAFKLAAGLKSSYTQTDNKADYFYTLEGITRPDYNKTNHFRYREDINAGYFNLNKDYKQLSVQAGLRLENTISTGHQLGNVQKPDSTFNRNYTGLFPTLYLQYKIDTAGNHQLGLNYGRRIDRPYYQNLNPFISPLDKFTYYVGNPFLKPAYTDNIELSHTYKNRITTTLLYSKTRDEVNETIEIVNGIYYSRPGNLGKVTLLLASLDATVDPAKWLNLHFYGHIAHLHSVSAFYTGLLDTKGTYFFLHPTANFKLLHDWNVQLDAGYQSKVTSAQFITGSRSRVDVAVSKKLSAHTTVKLVANDIFYHFIGNGIINNLALTRADYRNQSDTRTGVLSLSYRFGKAISGQRRHEAGGAQSEQDRVKN